MPEVSRRTFLQVAGAAGAVFVCGGCNAGGSVDGSVTPQNGMATLTFAMYPALMTTGSGVIVDINGSPIAVIRTGDATATALSAICTHSGCTVEIQSSSSVPLYCPCHGSEFSLTGQVIAGPARTSLRNYTTTVDANGVNVAIG